MIGYVEHRPPIANWIRALCFAGLALTATGSAIADDASCKAVFAAITRLVKTPNHQYLTQSSDAAGTATQAGEMIFTGKMTYILHDGKWQTSAVTPDETL
jgi:hypothetical protein